YSKVQGILLSWENLIGPRLSTALSASSMSLFERRVVADPGRTVRKPLDSYGSRCSAVAMTYRKAGDQARSGDEPRVGCRFVARDGNVSIETIWTGTIVLFCEPVFVN